MKKFSLQLMTVFLIVGLGGIGLLRSQNPLWTLPNNYLDGMVPQSLPTPTDPNNTYDPGEQYYYYQGQEAASTHNSMMDAQGNLLFFIVDEIVYDADGYAMGWLEKASSPYMSMKGTSEMVIVPDPGNCSRYYIISNALNHYNGNSNHIPHYAILDMSLPNEFFAGRMGGFVMNVDTPLYNIADMIDEPPFNDAPGLPRFGGVYFAVTPMRADNSYKLFISGSDHIFRFTIDEQGLAYDNYFLQTDVHYDRTYFMRSEMEIKAMPSGDYFLAYPLIRAIGDNTQYTEYSTVMVTLLNNAGVEIPSARRYYNIEHMNGENANIRGLEFSEDGRYLYMTHAEVSNRTSCVEYIDLGEVSYTIYPLHVDANEGRDYQYSLLEMGADGRIYAAKDNPTTQTSTALASLSNTNTPNPSNWNANALSVNFSPNHMAKPAIYIIPEDRAYILPDQIDGFNYYDMYEEVLECCLETRLSNDQLLSTGIETWTETMAAPPFTIDNGVVYIKDELRVKAGSVLTLENMEFRFSPTAKVIVERGSGGQNGGKLILKNTLFTVDDRCSPELMWPGIEVHGHPSQQQGFPHASSGSHNSIQGAVYILDNSRIQHALTGVATGTVLANGTVNSNYAGGIVVVQEATFFNNEKDVVLAAYQHINKSQFSNSTFMTNGLLKDPARYPMYHLALMGVNRVYVKGCVFRNLTPELYPANKQGTGIASLNSQFYVDRYCGIQSGCPNPVRSRFESLHYGIMAAGWIAPKPYLVDRADFVDNHTGIYTSDVNNFKIQRSDFSIYKSVAPNYTFETVGIHLDNCTGYIVQENTLEEGTTNGATGMGNTIGILVNNSGEADNEIYRNSFGNLRVGGQSQNTNSASYSPTQAYPNNVGLRWRCNEFIGNSYEADLGITSGRIAYQQGYCLPYGQPLGLKSPAGNKFSHSGNTPDNDIWANPGVLPFNYAHHADVITTPQDYTAAIVNPQHCSPAGDVYFDVPKSCPSRIRTNMIITVEEINTSMNALKSSLANNEVKIESGASQTLLDLIANPSATDQEKLDEMLEFSPYLSDEVLMAYFDATVDFKDLEEVAIANSPLSDTVWQYLGTLSLPSAIMDSLTNHQVGVSVRDFTVNAIGFDRNEYTRLADELIGLYLLDTTMASSLDSVEMLLQREFSGVEQTKRMIGYYLMTGDSLSADTELAAYDAAVGKDTYYEMATLLIDHGGSVSNLAEAVASDTFLLQDVEVIAADSSQRSLRTAAQALLEIAVGHEYEREIEPLIFDKKSMVAAGASEQENPEEPTATQMDQVVLFPNPASGSFNVLLDGLGETPEHTVITVYSLSGRLVTTTEDKGGNNRITVPTTGMAPGMYLVIVNVNGTAVSKQKLAVE